MSFDGTDIAAVITAIGGVATGIITHRRGKRTEQKTKKSPTDQIQDSYATLVEDLREELAAMREHYRSELHNLTNQLHAEREQWLLDRSMLEQEIRKLREKRGGE